MTSHALALRRPLQDTLDVQVWVEDEVANSGAEHDSKDEIRLKTHGHICTESVVMCRGE